MSNLYEQYLFEHPRPNYLRSTIEETDQYYFLLMNALTDQYRLEFASGNINALDNLIDAVMGERELTISELRHFEYERSIFDSLRHDLTESLLADNFDAIYEILLRNLQLERMFIIRIMNLTL
jgi:hypothetical protein